MLENVKAKIKTYKELLALVAVVLLVVAFIAFVSSWERSSETSCPGDDAALASELGLPDTVEDGSEYTTEDDHYYSMSGNGVAGAVLA